MSAREVSAQECVYRCMPELWLRKVFPGIIFVNKDLSESRLKMIKKKQDLEQLDEESTDIFQRNLIDRYTDRPYVDNVNNLCLAKFAAYYYKVSIYDSEYEDPANDNQPQVLTDDVAENLDEEDTSLPEKINLISSKEVIKKRKVRAIVRFHKFSETKEPEKCAHHSLTLYFPWRKESDCLGNDGPYSSKLGDQFVKETVARHRLFLEPYCEEVETAQELLSNTSDTDNIFGIVDTCGDKNSENGALMDDDTADSAYRQDPSHLTQESTTLQCTVPMVSHVQPTILDSEELHSMIRSLNQQQRLAFGTVLTYCRNVVKCPSDHCSPVVHYRWCRGWQKSLDQNDLPNGNTNIQISSRKPRETISIAACTNRYISNQCIWDNN